MKTKQFLLTLLLLLGGASFAWAADIAPTTDVFFRTSLNEGTYSWSNGYPKTAAAVANGNMAGNYRVGMFVLQKYSVENLKAVNSLVLHLQRYEGGNGGDAIAVWAFSTNDWSNESTAATMASTVNGIVGLNLNTTGTPSNSPLVNGGSNEADSKFTFDAEDLQAIKDAATYEGTTGTFTLLLTNKTSDMSNTKSGDRKFYGSGNDTEANHPYIAVEYAPVVLETNSTISTYSTLNGAFDGIADAGIGTITLYDNTTITGRCNSGTKNISVIPVKNGITVTSSLTNSLWFLTQTSGTVSIGSDSYQLTIDGQNKSNSSSYVEAGNNSNSTTFNNVKFKDCTTSADGITSSIVCYKANGGILNLKNVVFDGCSVTTPERGLVFCGLPNLNIQGGMTVTECTSDYDIYIENNNNTDKFLKVKEMTKQPSQPIKVYCKTPALGTIVLSTNYTDMTSWFKVMNDNYGLAYKSTNGDNILTEAYTETMNTYGASTLILPFDTKIPAGVTAYTLNYSTGNSAVKATEVTGGTLSANTPVLINGEADTKYWFINTSIVDAATTGSGTHTNGALTGVYAESAVPAGSYILWANASNPIGFYEANNSKVAANRAYLTADGAGVRALTIDFSGDETGVNAIDNGQLTMDNAVYDLQGRRVSRPAKGLYIMNGKKVVLK